MTSVQAYAEPEFSDNIALYSKEWKGMAANHLCGFVFLWLRTILLLNQKYSELL